MKELNADFKPDFWLDKWFGALETLGESCDIPYGRLKNGQIQWRCMDHKQVDGIGGLASLLVEESIDASRLPEAKIRDYPGLFRKISATLRYLFMLNSGRIPWKDRDIARKTPNTPPSWVHFSRAETDELKEAAKRLHVSLNSLLLCALSRSVTELLTDPQAPQSWLIPFNMRGLVRRSSPLQNHAVYVSVQTSSDASVSTIHANVRRELQTCAHWGTWYGLRILSLLGRRMMDRLMKLHAWRDNTMTGVLSNLGDWSTYQKPSGQNPNLPTGEGWVFCPPSTRFQPIAAGSLIFADELRLALHLSPVLRAGDTSSEKLISLWKKNLFTLASSA